jgi:twinkle protein
MGQVQTDTPTLQSALNSALAASRTGERIQETFEDYGIYGLRYDGSTNERVICPECSPHRQPKHQRERDLTVWVQEGTWHCNHCGWGKGMKLKSVRSVGGSVGKAASPSPPNQAKIMPINETANPIKPVSDGRVRRFHDLDDEAIAYFAERGISRETAEAMGVAVFPESKLGGEKRWLAFPLYVGDTLVNWKYRHNPNPETKEFSQSSGASKVWMNLNSIKDSNYCLITEGEIDLASFLECGEKPVISVPEGAPNHDAKDLPEKLRFVDDLMPYFGHIERVYLALDNDKNGKRLEKELVERFGKTRCWLLSYPSGCKDANDVLRMHGKDALLQCFHSAEPYPITGVVKVSDFRNMVEDLYHNGLPPNARTRFEGIDNIFKVFPGVGTLNIITGIPSHGKTVFLDNYLLSLAEKNGLRFGIYSREHRPDFHTARLAEITAGKRFLPTYNNRMDAEEKDAAVSFVQQHFFHLYDFKDERYFTMQEIMELAVYLQKSEGIDVLVVDPWNKITHEYLPSEKTERQYIARMLRTLHAFAKKTGLNIWVVAHTKKMGKANDGVNYEMPNAYSIADANEWFAMPDNILLLYRYFYVQSRSPTGESKTFFKTLKIKDDFYGQTERFVTLNFDPTCHRFYESDLAGQSRIINPRQEALPMADDDGETPF